MAGGGAGYLGRERQSFWVTLTTAFLWTPHSEARIDRLGAKLPAPSGGLVSSELAQTPAAAERDPTWGRIRPCNSD